MFAKIIQHWHENRAKLGPKSFVEPWEMRLGLGTC